MVIGLDGGSFSIIEPMIKKGKLPNLAYLAKNGYSAPLESTTPPVTAPAWPTVVTGVNPGKHGIFAFTKIMPDYSESPFSLSDLKKRTIYDMLTDNGHKCIAINVPMTYPPQKVDGIFVSGYGAPGEDCDFTYPPGIKDELLRKGYTILGFPARTFKFSEDTAEDLYKMLRENEKRRHAFARKYLRKVDWDFFMIVYSATDSLSHFFQKYHDRTHPLYEERHAHLGKRLEDIYSLVDSFLGDLRREYPDAKIIIMSDHGSGKTERYLYLNTYFEKEGLMTLNEKRARNKMTNYMQKRKITGMGIERMLKKMHLSWIKKIIPKRMKQRIPYTASPTLTEVDFGRTKFFTTGGWRAYINRKDYFDTGCVSPENVMLEYAKLKKKLLSLELDGKKVIERVLHRDEVYTGDDLLSFPDIFIEPDDFAYDILRAIPDGPVFGLPTQKSGTHRKYGIFYFYDPAGRSELHDGHGSPTLEDICPTVLALFDIPIPDYMDGKNLLKNGKESSKIVLEKKIIGDVLKKIDFKI